MTSPTPTSRSQTTPARSARRQRVDTALPKPMEDVEVGVGSVSPFSVPYQDAWEILRIGDVTVKQLAAMRKTDGQARALYRLITLPIRAALKGATFVPEVHVDGGEDEAMFVEQMFTLPESAGGMSVPFNRVVAQLLMAVFDGFTAFEMVYWSPSDGLLKGKWTLKKLAHRPAETLTFLIDDRTEFDGFRQQTMFQNRQIDVRLPREHCIYYAANEEENPFYGQSYFQSAWYHWDKKFKLYAIAHIAAQRAAVGTRVGKLPKNPNREEKLRFKQALAELGVAQYMTMPNDYDVESLKEGSNYDFLQLINHHNSQMSKSILAAFFDKEQGGGDSGKLVDFGSQSDALFLLMLQTIMAEIEEVINQKVIPRFIDWNFGSQKYPRFQFGSLSAEQKQTMIDLFKTLAVAGQSLSIRPEFVHELEVQVSEELGLEMDWETIEAKMAEEQAQAEAMAQRAAVLGGVGADGSPLDTTDGADAPAGQPAAGAAAGPAQIEPSAVPEGFTLSTVDDGDGEAVTLSELAGQLIDEAAQTLALVRGRPNDGGPKFVRTQAGAAIYGVPIGTAITRDMQHSKAGAQGQKGRSSGAANTDRGNKGDGRTGSKQLGGGLGDTGDLGGVQTHADGGTARVRAVYTNAKVPGARLLDFGDGTVAVVDAKGRQSPRQRWAVSAFARLGWKVDAGQAPAPSSGGGSAPKRSGVSEQAQAKARASKGRGKGSGGKGKGEATR